VGKTTLLREAARILAETKRVVIVDTSNEIGGDGDVPHPLWAARAACRSRSRPPARSDDRSGRKPQPRSHRHRRDRARTRSPGRPHHRRARRATDRHGPRPTLDNLLQNPTLSDLVGGIEAVTLSDEEARRRGTQKTVLERRAPPTFDVLIEIQSRDQFAIHADVTEAVDAFLRGYPLPAEIRMRDEDGRSRSRKR
jgi:hypothetical protein